MSNSAHSLVPANFPIFIRRNDFRGTNVTSTQVPLHESSPDRQRKCIPKAPMPGKSTSKPLVRSLEHKGPVSFFQDIESCDTMFGLELG